MKTEQNQLSNFEEEEKNAQSEFSLSRFLSMESKCISQQQASYVCMDKKCFSTNPFVCCSDSCECATIHLDCYQKSIKSLSKSIEAKKTQALQTENKINQVFDKINTKYSSEWDRILLKLKQKSSHNHLAVCESQSQISEIKDALKQNKLTGSLLEKNFNSTKMQQNRIEHAQNLSQIEKRAKKFEKNQMKNFFQSIEMLLGVEKDVYFDQKHINKTLERCHHLRLRCTNFQKEDNFSLGVLSPTINQLTKGQQKILKWRVKIHFITHWIGMGICLKKFLEKKEFTFNNYQTGDHGSFIISSNEYIWSYKNKEQNFKREGAFKMRMGDIVQIEFDTKKRELRFWHNRLAKELKMKVTYWPEQEQDEYCITLGMYQQGDEAEILEPVEIYDDEENKDDLFSSIGSISQQQ